MKKDSLRRKLIRLFWTTSTIPILVLSFFSYYNISHKIRENTKELTNISLKQIDDNLKIWIESYEDLLYQIYTDDDVCAWVDKLNNDQDVSVTRNQLRRYLRGLLNTKNYIRSITLITEDGSMITYDQLTPASFKNSWIENFSLSQDKIYEVVSADYQTHILPTEFGTQFANKNYYLFHLAHRIVDYRDLEKKSGIVIISIDEEFLGNICQTLNNDNVDSKNTNFIVDEKGRIITYSNQNKIGTKLVDENDDIDHKINVYKTFVDKENVYDKKYTSVFVHQDEDLGWDIVNVTDQSELMINLYRQIGIIVILSIFLLIIMVLLTLGMSDRLIESVKKVVLSMQKARAGNLAVRVEIDEKMPMEIEAIALQFNDMLERLDGALTKEKIAGEKQRQAEIKALEAQINPHFLYNTLDTINWMAIDKNEFDISNAINSLANILRYAIVNSNEEVSIKEEIDWLKKYIYLQQFRLKNKFICKVNVAPEIMEYKIHKLLLQPFVENAIVHGFSGMKEQHVLEVILEAEAKLLKIIVRDNGTGIEQTVQDQFNLGVFEKPQEGNHIGVENAITRLQMYYGENGKVRINSVISEGTEIIIYIPIKQ